MSDCGAHARTQKQECALCGGPLAVALPPPNDSIHWVQARLRAACPTCRAEAPIERLDADRFHCFPCQRELPFSVDFWHEQLRYGAAAGDCFWSRFERWSWQWPVDSTAVGEDAARLKELRRLAKGKQQEIEVRADFEETLGRSGRLTMAPGHPLCDSRHAPLSARFGDHGLVTMRCDACNRDKTYQAPADALAARTDLVAAVAPDHLQGAKRVQMQTDQQSAAVAITCPGCGGPLELAPGERMTNCSFCRLDSVVPTGVMAHAFRQPPPEQPIWLAMRAPSALQLRYQTEQRDHARTEEHLEDLRGLMKRHNGDIRSYVSAGMKMSLLIMLAGLAGGVILWSTPWRGSWAAWASCWGSIPRPFRPSTHSTLAGGSSEPRELMARKGYSVDVIKSTARAELTERKAEELLKVIEEL